MSSPVTGLERAYLYFTSDLQRAGTFDDASLAETTDRHHIELGVTELSDVADPSVAAARSTAAGVVFELASGLPSERHLRVIDQILRGGRRAWLYWPAEHAVECVDHERLASLRRHLKRVKWLKRICGPIDRVTALWDRVPTGLRWIYRGEFPVRRSDILMKLTLLSLRAQPVSLDPPSQDNGPARFPGVGLYLRADYWAEPSRDDGTRRVVAELATVTDRMVCLTASHHPFLDEAGIAQVVMDPPRQALGEDAIVLAPTHYWPIVKAACQTLRPAYLYERLCAGESIGAELSQLLGIAYVVEYDGAEALRREALNGAAPFYPELYSKAEELALRQATVVVVGRSSVKAELESRGIDRARVLVVDDDSGVGTRLRTFVATRAEGERRTASLETGDAYKDQVQNQWNQNPVGSQHARDAQPHTLDWFLEVEKHRYGVYAPWMPETMEFAHHAGQAVLEIGGGLGTDLAQFAAHGAVVTDIDLAAGHLRLAEENLRLRGLRGRFIHHDAEALPFDDKSFDLVYSNGVLHHTPNTVAVVREIWRVLRPGGRAIVMVYAENSLHFWRKLVWALGVKEGLLECFSMGEIMSRSVERSANDARPLVKVYTKARVGALFERFHPVEILQRQLLAEELPSALKWTLPFCERTLGWNLVVKATKSQ